MPNVRRSRNRRSRPSRRITVRAARVRVRRRVAPLNRRTFQRRYFRLRQHA